MGPPVCAIVRPRDAQEVQALVRACLERGTPIVTRGGGMSYTSGYLASAPESVLVDMARMNEIVEVNLEDRYVTVEVGCSWQKLHEHLTPLGVRTPFWERSRSLRHRGRWLVTELHILGQRPKRHCRR